MKTLREYPKIVITPKGERSIVYGHPWVYEGEVLEEEGAVDGELADVVNQKGSWLGCGFYNHHSKIRVRLISRNANDRFDRAFWKRRVRYAWDFRKKVMGPDIEACRLIFGEADQFPGLTVDKFGPILVTQTLSLGIEKRKDLIFPALAEVLKEDGIEIKGIYERNDVGIRSLEGMKEGTGFYPFDKLGLDGVTEDSLPARVQITENGVRYWVDYKEGQKTGFFLDQKYNRRAAAAIAKDMTVLDCFTDTGSFALNCAMGGANHVTAVDISASSLQVAAENRALNGLDDRIDFVEADVFDLLPKLMEEKKKEYDMIILDPPAFTKSRKTVASAERGYKEINYRAMKLLPRGGYLATCSCSHFMTEDLFKKMLRDAAYDAGVSLRQIEGRQQAPDHPILWNVPETSYLKFFIFQIV